MDGSMAQERTRPAAQGRRELSQRRRCDCISGAPPNEMPTGDQIRRSSSTSRRFDWQPRFLGEAKERTAPERKRRHQDLGGHTGPAVLELVASPDITVIITIRRYRMGMARFGFVVVGWLVVFVVEHEARALQLIMPRAPAPGQGERRD